MSNESMSTDNSHLFHRTINDENYVKKLEDLYYYALTKFGTGAEVILHQWPIEEGKSAADSDSAPWNGVPQDQMQKIKSAGANLYGLLITSLSDLMKDALDNAGVTRTIGGTDYYATIMAMVAEI